MPPRASTFSKVPIIRLHEEILELYEYLKPTDLEFNLRKKLVKNVENIVLEFWPDAQIKVFGSFTTGLYLPTSDIDIVVFGKWIQLPLWTMKNLILKYNLSFINDIQVLEHAKVPIVKFKDKSTHLNVDISFNMPNGVQTSYAIKYMVDSYPYIRPLIIILKLFLLQRNLNEVFLGGLSSYSLALMVLNFIQNHPRLLSDVTYLNNLSSVSDDSDATSICDNENDRSSLCKLNLGVLLLEFFEMFGRHFNYYGSGLRIILNPDVTSSNNPCPQSMDSYYYFPKSEFATYVSLTGTTSLLCIQDPITEGHDTAKSSWAFGKIKRAFEYGYVVLSRAVLPTFYEMEKESNSCAVLPQIINLPQDIIKYRNWIFKCHVRCSRSTSESHKMVEIPSALKLYGVDVSSFHVSPVKSKNTSTSRTKKRSKRLSANHKIKRKNNSNGY